MAFTTQPGGGGNTATWTTQPVVTVQDSGGNKVATNTTSVMLAIAENAGGTLGCTHTTVTTTGGVATFAGCEITGTAGTYTLSATSTGLASGTSSDFSITAGPASQVVFSTQPGGGADGSAWTVQPAVSVEDVSGNLVGTSTANITLSIHSQPGSGATLGCSNNPLAATGGVATFANCEITGQLGSYTLSASATGLASTNSNAFTITIGNPTKLAFTTQPGGGVDGATWGTQPAVSVEDPGGNVITTATNPVTLALGTNPGGTLNCTTNPLAANAGVASFAGCEITGKTGTYTVTASSTGLTSATSSALSITLGPAAQLAFTTQPGGGANTAVWAHQPVLTVQDVGGNTVTSTASITLALGTNPGGALACTTNPLNANAGVASFAGCKITGKAGTYTLTAAATGFTTVTSNTFTITFGAATQIAFSTQPGGGADGTAWGTQPAVSVEDASGNVVTNATNQITLALGTNPGGALNCTTNPLNANAGTASFAGCEITGKTGTYTLTAAATGFTTVTSNNVPITIGGATQLAFSTQPGGGADGTAWGTQPAVSVEDAGGNTVTTANNSITLAIATQPGTGATLACSGTGTNGDTLAATNGLASFAGCKITGKIGSYTINATATGLAGGTSLPFTITFGAATQIAFSAQPGGGANGAAWGTQPAVTIEDQSGNVVTNATNQITLALGTNPGGTLACTTNPLNANAGVASFAGCKITGKAGTYTLTAAATGFTTVTSNTFTITFGAATQIAFSTQPGGGADGTAWGTQPAVSVEDASGNVVTNATNQITLALGTNPGGTLNCTTNPLNANAGVASFAGCEITGKTGTYTLTAAATGFTTVTSNNLPITIGAATQLAFSTQPGGGADGTAWGTQPAVSVEDAGGNTVTTANNSITLAIATQPGTGATLACSGTGTNGDTLAATNGLASFAGCKITGKIGSYTINATATGLAGGTSLPFTITFGAATQIAFSAQPGGGANGAAWGTQPAVTIEDQSGNVVTNATNQITLALGTNPGGTLACTTNPLNANAGVASFAGCKITGKAGTYTLTAAATGFTTVTSNTFTITFGAATQIAFSTQPGGGADGTAWGTQPAVSVEDASGNVVTNATNQITLALGTNPGGALNCTTNPLNANAGVASFAGCKITGKTGTYTLTAAATGFTTVTSNNVPITIGGASQLVFSAQPGGGANGVAWGTQPAVSVEDAGGNVVTNATNQITLALGTNPGGTLACTPNPLNANAGVASFAGCKITGKAGTYTLTAAATGLAGATSNTFTISFGAATQIAFTAQPGGGANGAAWGTQPAVSVEDASGNVVTSANNSVTLAIGTNPGGTLACSGGDSLAANAGTASFAGCEITGKTGTYTLTAAATGFTTVTSSTLTITFGPGSQLVFSAQPGGGADSTAWGTQPAVTIEDESGNVVTNATNQITLALGTNPGGALNCTTNPLNANAGTASFAGCEITGKTGTYTLTAAATGFTTVTSNNVPITIGGASQLVFTTQPGGGVDGTAWGTQPKVTVEDAGGNTVTTANNSITLAIATQPGTGATLACSGTGTNGDTLAATNGLASFAGCKITGKIGSYTINATATGLAGGTSLPFTITIGTASELAFSTQPGGGASGAVWTTQPAVSVADVGGNPVNTGTNTITLAIASQPGTGATLACSGTGTNGDSLAATNGVANFAGCKITIGTAGTYTLSASTTGGLTAGTSAGFTVYGTATKLVFTTEPASAAGHGTPWTTQPVVTVEDAQGDVVANSTASITLSIATQPGFGATLSCSGTGTNGDTFTAVSRRGLLRRV